MSEVLIFFAGLKEINKKESANEIFCPALEKMITIDVSFFNGWKISYEIHLFFECFSTFCPRIDSQRNENIFG